MTSSALSRRSLRRLQTAALDLDRLARPALAAAVLASGLLIYHLTRGSSFSVDDWTWVDTRRGNSLHAFLAPYNGHLSLVPIAIYRVMFAVFGLGDFVPYRVLLLVVASATAVVIYEYARHRVGEFGALLVATLLLFLGPGWNDIMQPFQIAWLIAVAGGILALSLLDRRRRGADAAACLLILASLATTSVGVALAVGIGVDIALSRRRWRDAWIVGLPLVLYAVWAIRYGSSTVMLSFIPDVPLNLARTAAAGLAGVVGLSGVTPFDLTGQALTYGGPMLVLAAAAVIVRARRGWDPSRFLSLTAVLVAFSLLTTLARSFQSPFESRYMYVVCVVETMMAVELVRGLRFPPRAQLVLAALTVFAVVSNVGVLRSGGGYFRALGARTDARFGAVELDRGRVASDTAVALDPLGATTAGRYFAAARVLGTPAYTPAQLNHTDPAAQGAADAQSLADGDVVFAGTGAASPTGAGAPVVEGAVSGTAAEHGACVAFVPAAALEPGAASALTLRTGPGRVSVRTGDAPATLSVRRFAPAFTALGTVQSGGAATVSVSGGQVQQPAWHLEIRSVGPVRVCGLGGAA